MNGVFLVFYLFFGVFSLGLCEVNAHIQEIILENQRSSSILNILMCDNNLYNRKNSKNSHGANSSINKNYNRTSKTKLKAEINKFTNRKRDKFKFRSIGIVVIICVAFSLYNLHLFLFSNCK